MDIGHILLLALAVFTFWWGGNQERKHQVGTHLREDFIETRAKLIKQLDTVPQKRAELERVVAEIRLRAEREAERLIAAVGITL